MPDLTIERTFVFMEFHKQKSVTVNRLKEIKEKSIDYKFAFQAAKMIEKNRLNDAYELLQMGIAEYPGYQSGYQVLGDLYHQRGEKISATFAYFEALKRDADNPLTLMKLGDIFAAEGQNEEARKYYNDAFRLEPESKQLKQRLGKEERAGELKEFEFMTETTADLYLQQGHKNKARSIYLHLLRKMPDNSKLKEKLEKCEI